MKKRTEGYILVGLGLILLAVVITYMVTCSRENAALGFIPTVVVMVLLHFGIDILEKESPHKTPQPKPQKPFKIWAIKPPEADHKRPEQQIPKIWEKPKGEKR